MARALRLYFSLDGSDAVDLDTHLVACLEPLRRLHRKPDATRSSGKDYVAGFQRHGAAQVRDLIVHVEHQISGIGVLTPLAIDETSDAHGVGIANLVRGNNPGTDRRVSNDLPSTHCVVCICQSRTDTSLPAQ